MIGKTVHTLIGYNNRNTIILVETYSDCANAYKNGELNNKDDHCKVIRFEVYTTIVRAYNRGDWIGYRNW